MTSFDENKAALVAGIPVRPCRGPREPFLPFRDEKALLAALIRAEKAYNCAVTLEEDADRFAVLEGVLKEQNLFANHLEALQRCWETLSSPAKVDLGHSLEYQSSLTRLGDDEEALAVRPILSSDRLVAEFESKIIELQRAMPKHFVEADSSRKKDLKKNGISRTPLREFAYEMKLFWDESMTRKFGANSARVAPFSIARELLINAVNILTNVYISADFDWILRDIQKSGYDPEEFRTGRIEGLGMLTFLKPHLAEIPLSGSTAKYRLR